MRLRLGSREGADCVMVKPGMRIFDIVARVQTNISACRRSSITVSGEVRDRLRGACHAVGIDLTP